MGAMADMSRAIRAELQAWGPTIAAVPDDELDQYVQIVGEFYADLMDEKRKRDKDKEAFQVTRRRNFYDSWKFAHGLYFGKEGRGELPRPY